MTQTARGESRIELRTGGVLKSYEEKCSGFGPTLAAEKLQKEGYEVEHEKLR